MAVTEVDSIELPDNNCRTEAQDRATADLEAGYLLASGRGCRGHPAHC